MAIATHSPYQMVPLMLENICNLKIPYKEKSAIYFILCVHPPFTPFSENTTKLISMAKKVSNENAYKCVLFSFLWMSDEIILSGNA